MNIELIRARYADSVRLNPKGPYAQDTGVLLLEIDVLREALKFYADPTHWESNRFEDYFGPAFDDMGALARQVLKS